MKSYHVHITTAAERDLNRAADYIEFSLKNQLAANSLIDEAEEILSGLSHMPERFALVDDKLLAAWGIRLSRSRTILPSIRCHRWQTQRMSFAFCMEKAIGRLFCALV